MKGRKRKASVLKGDSNDNRYYNDEKRFRERTIRGEGNISIRDRGAVSISDTNACLEQHYNVFVSSARMRERDCEFRRRAICVDRRVPRIEDMWRKANEAIAKEMKELYDECDAFGAACKGLEFWWMQCHVLSKRVIAPVSSTWWKS